MPAGSTARPRTAGELVGRPLQASQTAASHDRRSSMSETASHVSVATAYTDRSRHFGDSIFIPVLGPVRAILPGVTPQPPARIPVPELRFDLRPPIEPGGDRLRGNRTSSCLHPSH
jgi:hypothetical protein